MMQLWRSLFRIFPIFLSGLAIVWLLQTCQSTMPMAPKAFQGTTATETANVLDVVSPSAALAPEIQALVDRTGPKGLYNPPRGDVRLVVISDLNSAYGSTDYEPEVDRAIALLPFWKPDMVLCSGDMVAGQSPSLTESQLQAMWSAFDAHITAPLRQAHLPFGFTIGNHDASSARKKSGGFLFDRERQIASQYWNEPAHNPGVEFVDRNEFPFYYTFKHKDIFFLVWDGSSAQIPQEKLDWVERSFQSPEAQNAKLRILLGHLPLYAVAMGRNDPGNVMASTEKLRNLLERHQVHTYISGHQHAYYPAHKGKLQLLHMGLLGAGPRPYIDNRLPLRKSLTVLDIQFNSSEMTTYTTYDMKTLQLIQNEELPRFLTGHNGMVLRRDLELEDLSASERAACERRLGPKLCQA